MSKIDPPKDSADVAKLKERHARPMLNSAERGETYARHERDHHGAEAKRIQDRADSEGRTLSASENAEVQSHYRSHREWSASYEGFKDEARAGRERIEIRRQPLTYRSPNEGGEWSFFSDSWQQRLGGNAEAEARLDRHAAEMKVEMPRWERRMADANRPQGAEYRTNPSTTTGRGGYFAPPLWANEAWADVPRPERVITSLFTKFPLPKGVQSVNIPRITTGVSTNAIEDLAPNASTDLADTSSTASVVLITGQEDVSIQLLEQSPMRAHLDRILFDSITESYDATIDSQAWNGLGGSDELNGILNQSGITNISTTETLGSKSFASISELFGAVADKRKRPPEAFFMRGGRWASLCALLDTSNRPLAPPLEVTTDTETNPVGTLFGLPVWLTESLPVTAGATGNKDVIVAARPNSYFWESPSLSLSLFDEVLSGTLQARIAARGYSALIHRFPSSYAVLTGYEVKTNL